MSQTYEDYVIPFFIRCEDVGLDCNCTIYGISEERTIDNTVIHMFEYHAINPEEMTTCMRLKMRENMHILHSPPPQSHSSHNNHF
jgi:predicted small metal-binding protein